MEFCKTAKEILQDDDEIDKCILTKCCDCNSNKLCYHEMSTCSICVESFCNECIVSDHLDICKKCISNPNNQMVDGSAIDILMK